MSLNMRFSVWRKMKSRFRTNGTARFLYELTKHLSMALSPNTLDSMVLKNFLKLYEIDSVVDVGANSGQFGIDLRRVGFEGKIWSFEPNPEVFKKILELDKRDTDWRKFNFALGSSNELRYLNEASNDGLSSSFLESSPYNNKVNYLRFDQSRLPYEVKRLDSLNLTREFDSKTMLKIDVQGFELEVLKGCGELLHLFSTLILEVSFKENYLNQPLFLDVLNYVKAFGFIPVDISNIMRVDKDLMQVDLYLAKEIRSSA